LGYMVKHTFVLRNTGNETLKIYRVGATCGCTTTALPTDTLAPGESVPLEVLVLADHGTAKNVAVRVYSNAPDERGQANDDRTDPDITMYVKGSLTPKQDYETAPFELAYDILVLLDLRDPSAYAANHLMGAINVPVSSLISSMAGLPKDFRYLAYDATGDVAGAAVQALVNAGYLFTFYIEGGLAHWVEIQGDRFLVSPSPLPPSGASSSADSNGRSWDQGELRGDFYYLIDLRDPSAFGAGHIPGAVNIPVAQLAQWFERIPRDARIILYDDTEGTTSMSAHQTLLGAGYASNRVTVLLGGLSEWVFQYGDGFVTRK
jgi:rhodanese-related sulfurtransferase